jgi:hypothetical protein
VTAIAIATHRVFILELLSRQKRSLDSSAGTDLRGT